MTEMHAFEFIFFVRHLSQTHHSKHNMNSPLTEGTENRSFTHISFVIIKMKLFLRGSQSRRQIPQFIITTHPI